MLLKRFEVFGFKSFADKTELDFGPGINAIVGPNGSGKSNLSDAIRWALGEQSIRTLRGAKMEDVIFAGTTQRKPLGIAEVSLTFDNYDALLPLDFGEVTITRRVFRSGESEYYINKSQCRLKDLHELLAGTGLGRESMAVIGQNKIDEILNSKPDERRLLFEEVIGIARYKQRRKEAVKKMEDTEQNLVRVRDILAEIETQLEPLKANAERTGRYNKIYSRYVQCKTSLYLNRYELAEKRLRQLADEEKTALDATIASSTKNSMLECDKELVLAELAHVEEQVLYYDRVLAAGNLAIQKLDGQIQVGRERMEHLAERREKDLKEHDRLLSRLDLLSGTLCDTEEKLNRLCLEKQAVESEYQAANDLLQTQTQSIKDLQQQIHSTRDLVFDQLQEVVDERNNLRQAERETETVTQTRQRQFREKEQLQQQYIEALELRESRDNELKKTQQQLLTLQTEQKASLEQKADAEKRLLELQQKEKAFNAQQQECVSRRKILASMQSAYEGFGLGSRSVLKSTEKWREGVLGAVAQLLKVPETYVTAIETALGQAMQNIVTVDEATAKMAVNYLKDNRLGRATFLPLESIKAQSNREIEAAAATADGFVGMASNLVHAEPRYKVLTEMLLGRTVVANDLDCAMKIARNSGQRLRIVTLDGELISPGGAITGGRSSQKEQGYLSRQNEIEDLGRTLETLGQQIQSLNTQLGGQVERIRQLEQQKQENERRFSQAELQRADLERGLVRWRQDEQRLKLAVETCEQEMEQAESQIAALRELTGKIQLNLVRLQERETLNKGKIDDWQRDLSDTQAAREIQDKKVTELLLRQNDLHHRTQTATADRTRQAAEKLAFETQMHELKSELHNTAKQLSRTEHELQLADKEKLELQDRTEKYRQLRNGISAEKNRLLGEAQRLERNLRDLKKRCQELTEQLHEVQLEYARNEYEVGHCRQQIEVHLGQSLSDAMACRLDGSTAELEQEAERCEKVMQEIGPVNPAAIEEYRRTADRYEFLQLQSKDLETAAAALGQIIADIDRTMAERFITGFAAINQHFADIFVRLFGGGSASLELSDSDNVLASGVEIFVQPPGKRRQNLALLSGGERAMTVISILFAFLAYRPAPFCVIDEIDSALDESNVRRFGEFLTEYSKKSQFIVVTHRKGTMEAADILHGVTMEDSGVSRLVSVKFLEEGKAMEEGRIMRGTV